MTVLYRFGGPQVDGISPVAGLVQGRDGALYGLTSSGGVVGGGGTAYRIDLAGNYQQLHSFGAPESNGYNPTGRLVQGSDGNFYGALAEGGAHNRGALFRMTPEGVVTTLYSFTATSADGWQPLGSLVQGADGNFYGTTSLGGAHNGGTIFRMTPGGTLTTLHSFGGVPLGPRGPGAVLLLASDGNFYGTTSTGGLANIGTIYRMSPNGTVTVMSEFGEGLVNFTVRGNGPTDELFEARDGLIYGMTAAGGAFGNAGAGTLFRMTKAGVRTTLYSFGPPQQAPGEPSGGLLQGRDGALYGTMLENWGVGQIGARTGQGVLFRFVP